MSNMDQAVHADSEINLDVDTIPDMNPCGGTSVCGNLEAMEDSLVGMTAHWFSQATGIPYNKLNYSPNRIVENRCGFDLSVGVFNTKKVRLRLQHKVTSAWCDKDLNFQLGASNGNPAKNRNKETRLYKQIQLLAESYCSSGKICRPYLVLHQCYCLHEYRRMGATINKVVIPSLEHPLRTICVDLSQPDLMKTIKSQTSFRLSFSTEAATETVKAEVKISRKTIAQLKTASLADLAKLLQ